MRQQQDIEKRLYWILTILGVCCYGVGLMRYSMTGLRGALASTLIGMSLQALGRSQVGDDRGKYTVLFGVLFYISRKIDDDTLLPARLFTNGR